MAEPDSPASPSGFRNLEPRSREERQAERSKDLLEKSRLEARYSGPKRHTVLPPGASPLVPVKASPAYCDEYDRFNRDVAGELHKQKQQVMHRKEEIYSNRRAEKFYKEQAKWDKEIATADRAEQKYQHHRDTGVGARRNKSSENYNILTLDYNSTPDGVALQFKDATTQYKSQLRAINIYSKSHSVTHNIITGEPLKLPLVSPARPVAPWDK